MLMKLKRFFPIVLLFITLVTGCLNYEQVSVIKTDNSGEMFIHYWSKLKTPYDTLLINQIGFYNSDSIKSQFDSSFIAIKNIEVYNDFTDSTIHGKIEFSYTDINRLNELMLFKGTEITIKEGGDGLKTFSQFLPSLITGFGLNTKELNIQLIYYLPGQVINQNADDLSRNKLTWNFNANNISSGYLLNATFRPYKLKETPSWILYLTLGVLVIVFAFLFKKRKS